MKIIYSDSPIELDMNLKQESIFLAGPTPRSKDVISWRIEAISILKSLKYDGQVLVPERENKEYKVDYIDQVEWEWYGLENCNKIIFWIPRNLTTMPAFTTNVEFGRYVTSGRVYYGRPDTAEKCRYLDWLYRKYNKRPIYNDLEDLLITL